MTLSLTPYIAGGIIGAPHAPYGLVLLGGADTTNLRFVAELQKDGTNSIN